MFRSRKLRYVWLLSVLLAVSPAGAQVRTDGNRANDANTRVGSGGFNDYSQRGPTVTQNDIIYSDVTGGKGFRGPLRERDPGAFAGPVGTRPLDRFIRNSAGVPEPYQPAYSLITPQPFYSETRYAPPPLGSVREGFTGGYIGTDVLPQSTFTTTAAAYDSGLITRAQPLGFSSILGTRSGYVGSEVGETFFQSALSSQAQQPSLSGSPLYGVQQLRPPGNSESPDFFDLYGPNSLLENGPDRMRVDNPDVQRLRNELKDLSQLPQARPGTGQEQTPERQEQQLQGPDQQNSLRPFESPEDRALNSRANDALSPGSLTADIKPQQTMRQQPIALTAQQLSAQYNELTQRLQRYQTPQMAAIQAAHDEQQAARQAVKPRGTPGGENASQPAANVPGPAFPPAGPLKIGSLADGVRVKGLRDLLKAAEDDMRNGDYQKAIDKYNTAHQALAGGKAATNPSLVLLGRGTAELAAGFYRNANIDLHRALADRALLMGQYEISNWIPRKRLDQVTRELQDLATNDKTAEMPDFLLAFVYYNTGEADQASRFLQDAQHRAGRSDPLLPLLQRYWNLPQRDRKNSAEDLNK